MNFAKKYSDEIIIKLTNNPAVDRDATLPFNAASLQKRFNAQIERLVERDATEDTRPILRKLLLDDRQIYADDETALFVKIFGDEAGLFGFGDAGGDFKILSLCFTVTEDDDARTALDFVFNAFVKVFLPNVPINEFIAVMSSNNFLTAAGTTFELVEIGELNMLNVFVD